MLTIDYARRSPYGDGLPDDMLMSEVQDVRTVAVAKGVEIGYALLNRQRIGEAAAIVAIGGFMSSLTSPDRGYEGVQLAALDRPVLMLDLPGHGLSTPHSAKQITDLCIRRSADSQTAPLIDATAKLLGPNDPLDYFGISHGALLSVKSAELDPGDRVGTVFGMDLPAVRRRKTLGLQSGYMLKDNVIGRRTYLGALHGSVHEQDFEVFKQRYEYGAPEKAKSFIKNNTGLFLLNLVASVNARPVGLQSWKNVMEQKSAAITVVTSENGSVSSPKAIQEFIDSLPEDQRKRSTQIVAAGEDHNLTITHLLPRAVGWAKSAYGQEV